MTPQAMFDQSAYHMLAHGGSPRDLFPHARGHLADDLERIHCNTPPERWPLELSRIAQTYKINSESANAAPKV